MDDPTRSVAPLDATASLADTKAAGEQPAVIAPSSATVRYVLGAEIARGGMGEVYRATDTTLDREVAVKVLHNKYTPDSGTARRFADEARITAQLQHPNIPAVHDLGALPDGRPFLAMKLIKGETLDESLKQRTCPADDRGRFVAIFEQVCQAVGYAHAHGVIHRDLKPSNVMVGSYGEVQVMDWGLAKVLADTRPTPADDPDATAPGTQVRTLRDSDDYFTQAGSVLGTPAYMAPEQAAGAAAKVDARSDVFGLGGLLAVILTGHPPFAGGSAETTRVKAATGDVADCFARLDASGADPELVALCKWCLSPHRDDRPSDAGEVARAVATLRAAADERARQAELDKVRVEGERAEAEVRAAEQAKRRRAVQWAAGTVAAVLLLGVAGTFVGLFRADTARRNAEAAERAASAQSARADTNLRKARDAVDLMLTGVGENKDLEGLPQWQTHRQKFLQDALGFYQGFLKESDDPTLRREAGQAYARVGRIHELLGKRQEAIDSVRHAITIQEQLAAEFPDEADDARDLARSYHQLGSLYESGAMPSAVEFHRKALLIRQRLADRFPDRPDALYELAWTCARLGFSYQFTGHRADANAALERAVTLFDRLVREQPGQASYEIALGNSSALQALALREDGRLNESLALSTRGVEALENVLRREPHSTDAKLWLSWRLMERAETLLRLGRGEDARNDWERRAAVGDGQTHVDLRLGRAQALARLGRHAPAVAEVETMLAAGAEPQQSHYNYACVYSLSAAAARGDSELPAGVRNRLADRYAQKAVDLLTDGHARGVYPSEIADYIDGDSDFEPLRARDDFKRLMDELRRAAKKGKLCQARG